MVTDPHPRLELTLACPIFHATGPWDLQHLPATPSGVFIEVEEAQT